MLQVSASITLAWQISAQEALSAEFSRIEPEHFFIALLKIVEIPVFQLQQLTKDASAVQSLTSEINYVAKELVERNIDTKVIRRKIRKKLGKGGKPVSGMEIHRSEASRKLFDRMALSATEAGDRAITLSHLLQSFLKDPTPILREVLGPSGGQKLVPLEGTPTLSALGTDLTLANFEGKLEADQKWKVEANALIHILSTKKKSGVVIICDSSDTAISIVHTAASMMPLMNDLPAVKNKRIFDLSTVFSGKDSFTEVVEQLRQGMVEAKTSQVILILPALSCGDKGFRDEWTSESLAILQQGDVQCIFPATRTVYENCIENDSDWKKSTQLLWVQDQKSDQIPDEL